MSSLIEALGRRSAAASYAKFCHVEGIIGKVAEELDALWVEKRPLAFAAADEGKGKYQLEYVCTLDNASALTEQDIEAALPEELAAIRRMNGGRLIVIRKFTSQNTFIINLHWPAERDLALAQLKAKHAGKRPREDVKPKVKVEKQDKEVKREAKVKRES